MESNLKEALTCDKLEVQLDSIDAASRERALHALCNMAAADPAMFPEPKPIANMHSHTFFSYNCYGYSPTHFAWLARRAGLEAAGIVDFDVLNGLDEFLAAGRTVGIKGSVGLESRVFVPEFASRVINSPGEPGVSYHMGSGFTTRRLEPAATEFLSNMRKASETRNRGLVNRVNAYLRSVQLDFEQDIVPLTPAGNITERHICLAYARKAMLTFQRSEDLADFWSERLGEKAEKLDLPDGPKLQNLIRSKTMKQGGPGYVAPDKGSFPRMADMNRFILEAGGIPMLTWLDGTSAGEKCIEELFTTAAASGAAAVNIIPDRNFTPGVKDQKLQNLYDVVQLAEKHNFPIIVGTEMNSPGQKFVDSFETSELAPLAPVFIKGARIMYGHTVLQTHARMGYTSKWASIHFTDTRSKNDFFEELGSRLRPSDKETSERDSEAGQLNDIMMELISRPAPTRKTL